MNFQIPSKYRTSIRIAEVLQVLSFILVRGWDTGTVTPIVVTFGAWVAFWIGVFVLVKLRENPSKPELVALSFGPLAILIIPSFF